VHPIKVAQLKQRVELEALDARHVLELARREVDGIQMKPDLRAVHPLLKLGNQGLTCGHPRIELGVEAGGHMEPLLSPEWRYAPAAPAAPPAL